MQNTLKALGWRYATKKYNPEKKLTEKQLEDVLEAVRLAPASFGLLPYQVIVVKDVEVRKKLREAAFGQSQITDASDLLVFAVKKHFDEKDVDEYLEEVSKVRGVPVEQMKDYAAMMKGSVASRAPEQRLEWSARQAYIALGVLLTSTAVAGIDASPMEGFDSAAFDSILGLEKKGLKTVVVAAIGYRDESDDYLNMKKVRFPKEKIFQEV